MDSHYFIPALADFAVILHSVGFNLQITSEKGGFLDLWSTELVYYRSLLRTM